MDAQIDGMKNTEHNPLKGVKDFAEKTIGDVKAKARELTANSEGVEAGKSGEGALTKRIENVTSKIPSAAFLSLAIGSVGLAGILRLFGRKDDAQFVGHWVPTILTLGLYNKLVKLEGSE